MYKMIVRKMNVGCGVEYEFIKDKNIEYMGDILRPQQIENLKIHGNTVIPLTMYEKLGKEAILEEAQRLTEIENLEIVVKRSNVEGATVIIQRVKEWVLDTQGRQFKLLHYGEIYYSWNRKEFKLDQVRFDIERNFKIKEYEER